MAKGSCMCGQIGYEYTGEPASTVLCHCTDCQKLSGTAYASNVVVPRTAFKVTKGSPKTYDAVGGSGKFNNHYFCGNCGSSLYTELEIMPDMACIKSAGLDGGAANHDVKVEFYTNDRLGYVSAVNGAEQKPAFREWRYVAKHKHGPKVDKHLNAIALNSTTR